MFISWSDEYVNMIFFVRIWLYVGYFMSTFYSILYAMI